jgi:hypothetical protein
MEATHSRSSATTADLLSSEQVAALVSAACRRVTPAGNGDTSRGHEPEALLAARHARTTSLDDPEFRSAPWRIDWATLLQRVYATPRYLFALPALSGRERVMAGEALSRFAAGPQPTPQPVKHAM